MHTFLMKSNNLMAFSSVSIKRILMTLYFLSTINSWTRYANVLFSFQEQVEWWSYYNIPLQLPHELESLREKISPVTRQSLHKTKTIMQNDVFRLSCEKKMQFKPQEWPIREHSITMFLQLFVRNICITDNSTSGTNDNKNIKLYYQNFCNSHRRQHY